MVNYFIFLFDLLYTLYEIDYTSILQFKSQILKADKLLNILLNYI